MLANAGGRDPSPASPTARPHSGPAQATVRGFGEDQAGLLCASYGTGDYAAGGAPEPHQRHPAG